jgi:NifB/MoaA-like Fe-S oxidoreductase
MKKLHGTRVVYPADEFYLMAGEKIPGFAAYEDFPQLENGVGMSSLFKHEFSAELSRLKRSMAVKTEDGYEGRVGIVTGMLAEPMLTEMASKMSKVIAEAGHKVQIDVYPIQNEFFGHGVTVAGLVTGRDIAKQVGKKATGSKVLLPQSMLRSGEETFLDDWTVSRLSDSLKCDIIPVRCDGRELVRMIAGVLKK